METKSLILVIFIGVGLELLIWMLLRALGKLSGKTIATLLALIVISVFIPWSVLNWPGVDVFSIELAIFMIVAYILAIVDKEGGKKWHWAPAALFGFFAFVVAANVVFLGVAEHGITGIFSSLLPKPRGSEVADSRFPGTVSHDFQEKEALYNQYLEQVEEQIKRGWIIRKGWQNKPVVNQPELFMLEVKDKNHQPVTGAHIHGQFLRPSNVNYDISFAMKEQAPGRYSSELTMPQYGNWDLVLTISKEEDIHEIRASTQVLNR